MRLKQFVFLLAIAPALSRAGAQCQVAGIVAPDSPPTNARFGSGVGIENGLLAVGARGMFSSPTIRGGAVYIYSRNAAGQWINTQKLTASDIAAGDEFGVSLELKADRIIVGSWLDDDAGSGSGSAYIFRDSGSGFQEEVKLVADDAVAGDRFGVSVSVNGDDAIVGAPYTTQFGFQTGAAYIFHRGASGWAQVIKLERGPNQAGALFGNNVAILGDVAVVSAPGDSFGGFSRGAVYVYRRTAGVWQFDRRLQAADGADNDGFGAAMSLSGDSLLVGAYVADGPAGLDQGAAYVFRDGRAGWAQEAKLVASDAHATDLFGGGVALNGDLAVAAAYMADLPGGTDQGAGYIFRRSGTLWTQIAKIRANDAGTSDILGTAAAIDPQFVALGAMFSNTANTDAGEAYVFSIQTCSCYGNCDGSTLEPRLNVADYICFMNAYAAGDAYANCDQSTLPPVLNVADYICFMNQFAAGCQ